MIQHNFVEFDEHLNGRKMFYRVESFHTYVYRRFMFCFFFIGYHWHLWAHKIYGIDYFVRRAIAIVTIE